MASASVTASLDVRPALNLDLADVRFTSAAQGGKGSATVGGGFAAVAPTTAGEKVKFTMEDTADQALDSVTMTSPGSPAPISTLKFDYSGASTGLNQYVSAVLKDNDGKLVYYAKLADTSSSESGTVSASLAGVADGDYTLEIFSEQANGENSTDFCSDVQIFDISVKNSTPPPANIKVNSIAASQKTVYVVKGKSAKLPYIISASAAGKVPVTWKASKKAVASVGSVKKANGTLSAATNKNQNLAIKTGKKLGTSKITLTSGGKKLVVNVKVVKRAKAVAKSSVKIKSLPKKNVLKVGASKVLKPTFTKGATAVVTWKSSKPSIAKIDASGKIVALKKGKTTITLKAGNKTKKATITVK
jgi:hypothetical protein